MRRHLPGRRTQVSSQIARNLQLAGRERILTFAVDDNTHAHVVATTTHVVVATDERQVLRRPWHDVDAGQWSAEHWTLSIAWVGASRGAQWTFRDQDTRLPETVHERVQASIVLSADLPLPGRHKGRVVVRKDLASGEMLMQTILGRGTPAADPQVRAVVDEVSADLRERVGL